MTLLLEKETVLYEKDEKTNVILPFEVEKDCSYMEICFSYEPKTCEDMARCREKIQQCIMKDAGEYKDCYGHWQDYLPLKNLITVSLDDEKGYRGCAHRQDEVQRHILSEAEASPGFIKGRITKGQWRVLLNVHALVSEKCRCKITVRAGDDLE